MKKRTVGVLLAAFFAMALTGCGDKQPQPGEVKGYDKGEEYLSIWVHSIEDTEEGQCYRKSVEHLIRNMMGNILQILNLFHEMTVVEAIRIRSMHP